MTYEQLHRLIVMTAWILILAGIVRLIWKTCTRDHTACIQPGQHFVPRNDNWDLPPTSALRVDAISIDGKEARCTGLAQVISFPSGFRMENCFHVGDMPVRTLLRTHRPITLEEAHRLNFII